MIWALFLACTGSPDAPEDLQYDHVACDHCGMLVSDPAYAAQLITLDGERFEFDDPACLFDYTMEHEPKIAHAWFHDNARPDEDAWLDWQQVAFVPAEHAPMNGGLAAVPIGAPAGLSFGEASAVVAERKAHP